jgi:integrator complex subunit 3
MHSNLNKLLITQTSQQSQQQSGHHHHSAHHHYHQPQNESKLYTLTSIELKDQLETVLEEAFNKLQNLIAPNTSQSNQQPESVLINELTQYSNQSKIHSEEVSNAFLYSILTDPSNSTRSLRNLLLLNNFSFNFGQSEASSASSYTLIINNLLVITTDFYSKLQDVPRKQLLWLLKELSKAKINQLEKLLLQMLRNIQSSSMTDKNIWLADQVLDILYDQNNSANINQNANGSSNPNEQQLANLWIYSYNELLMQAVYTYLRVLADHAQNPNLNQLKQRETDFCIHVLR